MKVQNFVRLFAVAFVVGWAGCAHSPQYDPSQPGASRNRVKVISLSADPAKPIAPQSWQITMNVKNVGDQPLENVSYKFLLGGKGEHLGAGKIARLNAGETVSVTSDAAKVGQGTYRVEGRVFLEKLLEAEFSDRMDNWMATTVVVAQ